MKIVRIILLQYQNLLSTIMTIDEIDLKTLAKINRQCNIAPSLNSQSSDSLHSKAFDFNSMVSIVRLNYIRHTLNYFANHILMPMTFQDGCSTRLNRF